MPTLTIRNIPDETVQRIKRIASNHGHSMEQEIRDLITERYVGHQALISRIKDRWQAMPKSSAAELKEWRNYGRT